MMADKGMYSLTWDRNHGGDLVFLTHTHSHTQSFDFVIGEGWARHAKKLTGLDKMAYHREGQLLKTRLPEPEDDCD